MALPYDTLKGVNPRKSIHNAIVLAAKYFWPSMSLHSVSILNHQLTPLINKVVLSHETSSIFRGSSLFKCSINVLFFISIKNNSSCRFANNKFDILITHTNLPPLFTFLWPPTDRQRLARALRRTPFSKASLHFLKRQAI